MNVRNNIPLHELTGVRPPSFEISPPYSGTNTCPFCLSHSDTWSHRRDCASNPNRKDQS